MEQRKWLDILKTTQTQVSNSCGLVQFFLFYYLEENEIKDSGAEAIEQAAKGCETLQKLWIRKQRISTKFKIRRKSNWGRQ